MEIKIPEEKKSVIRGRNVNKIRIKDGSMDREYLKTSFCKSMISISGMA